MRALATLAAGVSPRRPNSVTVRPNGVLDRDKAMTTRNIKRLYERWDSREIRRRRLQRPPRHPRSPPACSAPPESRDPCYRITQFKIESVMRICDGNRSAVLNVQGALCFRDSLVTILSPFSSRYIAT